MSHLRLEKVMSHRGANWLLACVAMSSPLWMSACGPSVPALDIWAAGELFPTHTSVLVQVSAPAPGSGCGTRNNEISFVEASCGEGCIAEDAGPGESGGSIQIRVTVTSPGVKRLDVVVEDAELGRRAGFADLEFADVTRLETMHDAKRDPGTAQPVLPGMDLYWCAQAFAEDEREVSLFASPTNLRSSNAALAVEQSLATMAGPCWSFGAAAPGLGQLTLSVGGQTDEHSVEVIDEDDIAEIHLHRAALTDEHWLPVDEAGMPDATELTSIVAPDPASFLVEAVVRLVTKDGRIARGSVDWFRADDESVVLGEHYRDGHRFTVELGSGPHPRGSCLRATMGTAHLDLPVYIDSRPEDIENPCLEPPGPSGEGGAGGAGGMGGAGGAEP